MIMFKACPRCGGDIDATFFDDVYCVQCGNRPRVAFPEPRILTEPEVVLLEQTPPEQHPLCPMCASSKVTRLNKVRPDYNTCYRCYRCGHIYSPNTEEHDWRDNAG